MCELDGRGGDDLASFRLQFEERSSLQTRVRKTQQISGAFATDWVAQDCPSVLRTGALHTSTPAALFLLFRIVAEAPPGFSLLRRGRLWQRALGWRFLSSTSPGTCGLGDLRRKRVIHFLRQRCFPSLHGARSLRLSHASRVSQRPRPCRAAFSFGGFGCRGFLLAPTTHQLQGASVRVYLGDRAGRLTSAIISPTQSQDGLRFTSNNKSRTRPCQASWSAPAIAGSSRSSSLLKWFRHDATASIASTCASPHGWPHTQSEHQLRI